MASHCCDRFRSLYETLALNLDVHKAAACNFTIRNVVFSANNVMLFV